MRRVLAAFLLMAFTIISTASCENKDIGNDKKTSSNVEELQVDSEKVITTWGWYEESFKACFSEFKKIHPEVRLEYISVSPENGEYMQKVQTTIASGNRLPDILWGERSLGLRGELFDYDIWEDLGKQPYNVDTNKFFDHTTKLITNSKGQICGLDWELDAAGIAYRRDLAKKYIGTDDPDELESKLKDWESFIKVGKTVNEKSNGKVTMLSGLRDAYNILIDQNSESIAVNDAIETEGVLKNTFKMLCRMRDANILGQYETWTPSWRLSYSEGTVIFYPCATWTVDLVIKPNDKNGSGNWGLIVPPGGGFCTGGTTFGITKDSPNKEISWTFLNWFLNSEEGAKVNKRMGNHFIPLKSMYVEPDFISQRSPFFADQDIGKIWLQKISPKLKVRNISKYDRVIVDTSTVVMRAMALDRKIDSDASIKMWRKLASDNNPDLCIR